MAAARPEPLWVLPLCVLCVRLSGGEFGSHLLSGQGDLASVLVDGGCLALRAEVSDLPSPGEVTRAPRRDGGRQQSKAMMRERVPPPGSVTLGYAERWILGGASTEAGSRSGSGIEGRGRRLLVEMEVR